MIGSIIVALFGAKSVRYSSQHGEASSSKIELRIREANVKETLSYEIFCREEVIEDYRKITHHPSTIEGDSLQEHLLEYLISDNKPSLLFNPNDEARLISLSSEKYEAITELVKSDADAYELWLSIRELFNQRAHLNQLERIASYGQLQILRLSQEYIKRQGSPVSIPFLVDSPFRFLDARGSSLAVRLLNAIGDKDQVVLFTHSPEYFMKSDLLKAHIPLPQPRRRASPVGYRYGFLKETTPASKPYIVTEGKTDWKHLKAALAYLRSQGEFSELDVEFWEYGDEAQMGSAELLKFCEQYCKLPKPRLIICVFDRDESSVIKQASLENAPYKDWGNNVFSLVIPVPSYRQNNPEICIEFYYQDNDVMRLDSNGRRLFLSNEFDAKSGRHINRNLNYTLVNKLRRLTIIDDNVFDENNSNLALSKDDFATNVLDQTPEFRNIDFSGFKIIFKTIEKIVKQSHPTFAEF